MKQEITNNQTITKTIRTPHGAKVSDYLGRLQTPGNEYGASENWLIVACAVRSLATHDEVALTHLHSAKGWPADIAEQVISLAIKRTRPPKSVRTKNNFVRRKVITKEISAHKKRAIVPSA